LAPKWSEKLMYSWINHNSLYILIFLFPVLVTIFVYIYISKNKLLLLSSFLLLTLFFILIKIFFQPQSTENINQIELAEIINNESDVVIEFFSPNCMGCVLSEKAVNEFIEKYSNRYKIIKLNISDKRYAELVSENLVTVTPTFIYYKDGEMIEKYVGMLNDSDKLHEKFNQK
jgi:thiol-disulfide isomerase/thioredoxin